MIRKVGRYKIMVTDKEVTRDNFWEHSVTILEPEFIQIDKSDLCLLFAETFRYSESEKEISDVLHGHIRNLKNRIIRLERISK